MSEALSSLIGPLPERPHPRKPRPGPLVWAVVCYTLACPLLLSFFGTSAALGAVGVATALAWFAGFALLYRHPGVAHWQPFFVTYAEVLWCVCGVVAAAILIGGEHDRLPLVGLVFCMLHAGLKLPARRVAQLVLLTLALYAGLLLAAARTDLLFAWPVNLALAALMVAAWLVAREFAGRRRVDRRRTRALREELALTERLALTDPLTGLPNRRHLETFVAHQLAVAQRAGGGAPVQLSLCYCDLDHFKRVNDRFGHAGGDSLLRRFATEARACVRSVDLVARLGGEEFVLVLLDTSGAGARDVVERLRRRTARIPVSAADPGYHVTLSVGVASLRPKDTFESLLRRADERVYTAKSGGRNRVVAA
ncbi:MAG: GGDEF domain-containing protein [Pseudomonadota bacterium]